MYKKITHLFVLSCEKATFLVEKQLHSPLSLIEKQQLRIHLSICKNCAAYKYKAIFLDRLLADESTKAENANPFPEEEMSCMKEKFRTAIRQRDKTDFL